MVAIGSTSILRALGAAALGALGAASTDDTVDLRVTVGNTKLDGEAAASLLDVSVAKTIGEAAQLTLRVAAWDSDAEELRWVDDELFAPGAAIEVELGYLGRRAKVFSGDIVSLSLEASTTDRAVLTITAYDVLHRLGRGQRTDLYKDKTYAGIVRDVAQRIYRLEADAPDRPELDQEHKAVHQRNQSDLAFLLERAAEIDHELLARGATLVFRKSRRGDPPELTLDASRDLIQLSAHLSAASQLGGVDVKILSSETKEHLLIGEDNAGAEDRAYRTGATRTVIVEDPLATQDQARARARAELARMRDGYLDATGTALGRPDLEAGMMIQIDGLGTRFGGAYHVTSVTHSLSAGSGLRTSFSLKGQPR